MPQPTPIVEGVRDYSTPGSDTVEVFVRPGYRYGEAGPGECVRVDAREMKIPASAETLCTPREYEAIMAEAGRRAAAAAKPPHRPAHDVKASIDAQLHAATQAAIDRRRGDRRFQPAPAGE